MNGSEDNYYYGSDMNGSEDNYYYGSDMNGSEDNYYYGYIMEDLLLWIRHFLIIIMFLNNNIMVQFLFKFLKNIKDENTEDN